MAEGSARGPTHTPQALTATTGDSKAHNIGGHLLTSPPVMSARTRALSLTDSGRVGDGDEGEVTAQQTVTIKDMTARVKRYSEAMWGNTSTDTVRIEGLLEEAYRVHDVPLNEEAATQWGKDNFPEGITQSAVDECEGALEKRGGDFEAMARERLAELLPSRLNPTRINSCIHDTNPEKQLLMELAGGMEVDLPAGFTPNGEAPETRSTLRKMYVKTHLAVDCMFYAIYTQGLAFLLKTSTALKIKGVQGPRHRGTPAYFTTSGRYGTITFTRTG